MLKNRTVAYKIWWGVDMLLLLARVAIPILMLVNLFSDSTADDIARRTIIILLIDFGTLLALLGLNIYLRLFKRLTWAVMLATPALLFAVMLLSVVILAYEGTPTEQSIETACWILTAVYLILPDGFIARDVISAAKTGFSLPDTSEPKKLTLSQRIRSAKK